MFRIICSFLLFLALLPQLAHACDICALYNASFLQGHSAGSVTTSVSETYTRYKKGKAANSFSKGNAEYVKDYSNTQFSLAYGLTESATLQLNIPLIYKRSEFVKRYETRTEQDSGLGDISLGLGYTFLDYKKINTDETNLNFRSAFFSALKFPTGDTGSFEEKNVEKNTEKKAVFRHHPVSTAAGQRVLTFGTGSYDYILGLNSLFSYQRVSTYSNLQYTIRTEGDHDYEFHDDFIWSFGNNYFFILEHDYSIQAGVRLSYEYKGQDRQKVIYIDGTQVSNWLLGPEIIFTASEHLLGQLAIDFRVSAADSSASVVPESRFLGSVAYRF